MDDIEFLTIPESIEFIGDWAFYEFPKLGKIYFKAKKVECKFP